MKLASRSNQSILKEIGPEYSLEKTPMLGKIKGRRRRMTENEMVGWHESEQALGTGDGQGRLSCCSTQDCKESEMTEQLY